MLVIIQKLLEISMRLDQSDRKFLRILGKLLGVFPVWCSKWLEKRLFRGTWDPVRKYRRRRRRKKRSRSDRGRNQKG